MDIGDDEFLADSFMVDELQTARDSRKFQRILSPISGRQYKFIFFSNKNVASFSSFSKWKHI